MGRTWTPEQRKAHSDHMRQLYKYDRVLKLAGLPTKTRLRVKAQRFIVFPVDGCGEVLSGKSSRKNLMG